jgi:NAD(P)-dependent dehydrogenase (short-subunit alcohol dehydrogenase family)
MSKVVLIIGASRGIGKELVSLFAQDKSTKVYAFARNIEKMHASFDALENVHSFHLDLCGDSVRTDLENTLADLDKVDILINNAGYLVNKPFLELTREDFVDSYNANVIGVLQSVQAVLPKMKKNGGHVVSVSTMGAFQGSAKFPGLAAYSSSKTGVVTMTELLAEEFKDDHIKFNCLCLGAVQTEMLEEAFPGYQAPLNANQMATFIHDFACNAHQYLNGKVIPVSLSTP